MNNKIHLRVKKDLYNKWFKFEKANIRIQLAGDTRLGGFWLKQYAIKCGLPNFMADFTKILSEMEKDNKEIFVMYESPKIINFITED